MSFTNGTYVPGSVYLIPALYMRTMYMRLWMIMHFMAWDHCRYWACQKVWAIGHFCLWSVKLVGGLCPAIIQISSHLSFAHLGFQWCDYTHVSVWSQEEWPWQEKSWPCQCPAAESGCLWPWPPTCHHQIPEISKHYHETWKKSTIHNNKPVISDT